MISISITNYDDPILSGYEYDQIYLLAKYYPYSHSEVRRVFVSCSKSFDKTAKALELGAAYNSIEKGIAEVNKINAICPNNKKDINDPMAALMKCFEKLRTIKEKLDQDRFTEKNE